jgi:multicomponent Na+:H+ antiporter subunit B
VATATSALLVFLSEDYHGWRGVMNATVLDALEGGGATLYALCGFASMVIGAPFLTNFLPLGTPKDVCSGDLMLVENAGVACAISGGFAMIFLEFLEETRTKKGGAKK